MYKKLSLLCTLLIVVLARNALAEAKYYPVYNFDKVWGIAEPYVQDDESVENDLKKIMVSLKIPIPNRDPKEIVDKFYKKTIQINNHTYYVLSDSKPFLKAWLGREHIVAQVFTVDGSVYLEFPKVYVQEANECTDFLIIAGAEIRGVWRSYGVPLFGKLVNSIPKQNRLASYGERFKRITEKNIKIGYEIQSPPVMGDITLSKVEYDKDDWPIETLKYSSNGVTKTVGTFHVAYGNITMVHPIVDDNVLLIPFYSNANLKKQNWFFDRALYEIKGNNVQSVFFYSLDQHGLSCE